MPLTPVRFCCAAFVLIAVRAAAQPPDPAPVFDPYFKNALAQHNIPGAAFVLVQDGAVRFIRGYGVADRETGEAVDPHKTVFRIGSVSKLITATAAMQCVDDGTLALNADVNRYLDDFQIPDSFQEPVRVWHLLTHTPGFDERFLRIAVPDPQQLKPLGSYLAARLPRRVSPPGEVVNYSNHGITLLGYLVQRVTGMPFEHYVDARICEPLGMAPGGFHQPLPPALAERHAQSYRYDDGMYVPADLSGASQVWPSGAYATTAADMAAFMLAHLKGGAHNGSRILEEDTVHAMHTRQFMHHPDLIRGRGYGFALRFRNGRKVVWHTGRVQKFTSQLVLVPEENIGLFAVFNAGSGDQTRKPLFDLVAEHYFPRTTPPPEPETVSLPDETLADYAGRYRQTRHVRDGFEKLAVLGAEVIFKPAENGLVQHGFLEPLNEGTRWRPIGPDVFQTAGEKEPRRLAFRKNEQGDATYAFIELDRFISRDAFERLAWYEGTGFHLGTLLGALAVLLSGLVRGGVVLLRRRRAPIRVRANEGFAAAGAALLTAFILGLGYVFLFADKDQFAFGIPPLVHLLLMLPLAAMALMAIHTVLLFAWWARPDGHRFAKTHLTVILAAQWLFIALLDYWNLLGFRG